MYLSITCNRYLVFSSQVIYIIIIHTLKNFATNNFKFTKGFYILHVAYLNYHIVHDACSI